MLRVHVCIRYVYGEIVNRRECAGGGSGEGCGTRERVSNQRKRDRGVGGKAV